MEYKKYEMGALTPALPAAFSLLLLHSPSKQSIPGRSTLSDVIRRRVIIVILGDREDDVAFCWVVDAITRITTLLTIRYGEEQKDTAMNYTKYFSDEIHII